MDKDQPTVSISVLTFNRCSLLRELLGELSKLTYPQLEIIVIDNNSEDQTQDVAQNNFPNVRYMRMDKNYGAGGRNFGMMVAKGDIVVTLDDDVGQFTDAAIERVVSYFTQNLDLGALNFRVVNTGGETCNWVHHCKEEDYFDKTFGTYEITEGAVAFRKSALERAGYYPERFFLSHEGPDLAFRILEGGFKVIYAGDVTVRHLFSDEGRASWRNYYYDTRNQLWLAARNFPLGYAASYLLKGLSSMLLYSVRDGYFRYWVKALKDGVVGLKEVMLERKVLSEGTMKLIAEIDSKRPSLQYLIRRRLFNKNGLLFK